MLAWSWCGCTHCLCEAGVAALTACMELVWLHSLLAWRWCGCTHCLHGAGVAALTACLALVWLHSLLAWSWCGCTHCIWSIQVLVVEFSWLLFLRPSFFSSSVSAALCFQTYVLGSCVHRNLLVVDGIVGWCHAYKVTIRIKWLSVVKMDHIHLQAFGYSIFPHFL